MALAMVRILDPAPAVVGALALALPFAMVRTLASTLTSAMEGTLA